MYVPEQCRWTEDSRHFDKRIEATLNQYLTSIHDGNNGTFFVPREGKSGRFFICRASDGMDWEHVSISIPTENRCPTWEEMCYIKSLFWDDETPVMQLHAPRSEWVNMHPYCLHLWHPKKAEIPRPDPLMVGVNLKNQQNVTR